MSKTLHIQKRDIHPAKLMDELLTALPDLRVVSTKEAPADPKLRIFSKGRETWIEVPDDVEESAVEAVLAAHNPTPPQPPVTARQRLLEALAGANSIAALKTALTDYFTSEGG